MNYIAYRTDDGKNVGKILFYCKALEISRQAFYDYLKRKEQPWKYQPLADAMLKIHAADEENADYGRIRMFQALQYQKEIGKLGEVAIPSEGTVRKIMEQIHLIHKPKRKPNGITKADREARKSDDLLKRDFTADAPLQKCVTDITEIPAKDGKLYVSAIFDCYDLLPVGLAMADHMRAELCCETLKHASLRYPEIRGAIVHSDRGRKTEHYKMEELKFMVWRYFMSYWSNRRICSSIGGLSPAVKWQRFYAAVAIARFAS